MLAMNTQAQARMVAAMPTTDGAGVHIHRAIGTPALRHLDPFLLLDHLHSTGTDRVAGFPDHPHRGMCTLTYMLRGSMQHRDSMGHRDTVHAGGIQWMQAAHGVIHAEMPQPDEGELLGFQLWLNLPAAAKLSAPAYSQHQAADLPYWQQRDGNHNWSMRLLLGSHAGHHAPVQDAHTDALLLDVRLGDLHGGGPHGVSQQELVLPWRSDHNGFAYCYEGNVTLAGQTLPARHLLPLPATNSLVLGSQQPARLLLASGRPLREPIVQGGPFVMNTQAEILQAIDDYRSGSLTRMTV